MYLQIQNWPRHLAPTGWGVNAASATPNSPFTMASPLADARVLRATTATRRSSSACNFASDDGPARSQFIARRRDIVALYSAARRANCVACLAVSAQRSHQRRLHQRWDHGGAGAPDFSSRISVDARGAAKSNRPVSGPALASNESLPIRPSAQLSSIKRRIDVWSVTV